MFQMRKLILLAACAMLTALFAGNASAEELRGRFALDARMGVTNPANGWRTDPNGNGKLLVETDAGFIGGGGFLFGLDDNVAVDLEVTRSVYHTSGFGSAGVTDVAMGGQYRLPERRRMIPYVGGGVDVMINDLSNNAVDTVVGLHVKGGLDYMISRQVALNAELKGVEAFNADVKRYDGAKLGEFDPSNISFTVGLRLFFN